MGFPAVSYTHLDVYKRQDGISVLNANISGGWKNIRLPRNRKFTSRKLASSSIWCMKYVLRFINIYLCLFADQNLNTMVLNHLVKPNITGSIRRNQIRAADAIHNNTSANSTRPTSRPRPTTASTGGRWTATTSPRPRARAFPWHR